MCGKFKDGKTLTVVDYYADYYNKSQDQYQEKEIKIDFGKEKQNAEYQVYLLDQTHDGELVKTVKDLMFKLKPNSCILIKEI